MRKLSIRTFLSKQKRWGSSRSYIKGVKYRLLGPNHILWALLLDLKPDFQILFRIYQKNLPSKCIENYMEHFVEMWKYNKIFQTLKNIFSLLYFRKKLDSKLTFKMHLDSRISLSLENSLFKGFQIKEISVKNSKIAYD